MSYYVSGGEKIPLNLVEHAWFVVPTKVARESRALDPDKLDRDNIDMIVAENDKIADLLGQHKGLGVDRTFPKRFLVVRGDPAAMHSLKKEYKAGFHTRAAYCTGDGRHEVFLTDDIILTVKKRIVLEKLLGGVFQRLGLPLDGWRLLREEPNEVTGGRRVLVKILAPGDQDPLNVANLLATDKERVIYAHPDFLFKAKSAQWPSPVPYNPTAAPFYPEQWNLHRVSALEAWQAINMNFRGRPELWFGSGNIKIAVIDSGVDYNHPDLSANLLKPTHGDKWDFQDSDDDPSCSYPGSPNDAHGTACAGIIAARGNVTGIAPGCKIVPLRAFASNTDQVSQAFRKARRLGCQIISYSYIPVCTDDLHNAITWVTGSYLPRYARFEFLERRFPPPAPVFCCAGNDFGFLTEFPAWPETIAVGASTSADKWALGSCQGKELDFLAPGSDWNSSYACGTILTKPILTTDITGSGGYTTPPAAPAGGGASVPLNNYVLTCGTSLAAPLAAGVAALMLTVNPNLYPEDIRHILQITADKIDLANANYNPQGHSPTHGYGRINAANAVLKAIQWYKIWRGSPKKGP